MTEILWHGRGGQGAFTAARLLGAAYALRGKDCFALAFPSFGPERRGAPIRAFTKLSGRPIGDRSEVTRADYSIFLDDTLFTGAAFAELKEGGKILLCTKKEVPDPRVITVDGDSLAAAHLGLPITNTVMLGALAGVFSGIDVETIEEAIRQSMPEKLHAKNIAAVRAAASAVRAANTEREGSVSKV